MSEKTDDMKRPIVFALTVLMILSAVFSCGRGGKKFNWEKATLEEKIEHMRSDSSWIHELDSMAYFAIGPGAKCLDPVKHLFVLDGRYWVYNQDWGGVLELPEGYIPDDDTWQVEFSYHGARVVSPDSNVLISAYAGFQSMTYDEFVETARTQFDEQLFVKITSFRETEVRFRGGHVSKALEMETRTDDGIIGWARYIFASAESIEYNIFIQYPEDMERQVTGLKDMVKMYPFSPNGSDPHGGCL